MQYICLVYNEYDKLNALTDEELTEHVGAVGAWVQQLEQDGRHVFSAGLQSPATAATVRIRGGALSVTDGPFAETKEVLGGFTILEARDLNEAIQLASKMAVPRIGTVEVRPLMDFAGDMPGKHEQRLSRIIRALNAPQA